MFLCCCKMWQEAEMMSRQHWEMITDVVEGQMWCLEGSDALYLCWKAVFSGPAHTENWLSADFFTACIDAQRPIIVALYLGLCSFGLLAKYVVDLVLCASCLFSYAPFQVTYSVRVGGLWESRIFNCFSSKSFQNCEKESRPWQGTINNYHYNVFEFCFMWLSSRPCPSCWYWPEVRFIFTFQADQINPAKCVLAKSVP